MLVRIEGRYPKYWIEAVNTGADESGMIVVDIPKSKVVWLNDINEQSLEGQDYLETVMDTIVCVERIVILEICDTVRGETCGKISVQKSIEDLPKGVGYILGKPFLRAFREGTIGSLSAKHWWCDKVEEKGIDKYEFEGLFRGWSVEVGDTFIRVTTADGNTYMSCR